MPRQDLAVLLTRFRTLQVIAPHPDDEIFGCAGLIMLAASLGLHVRVHIATDGEQCFGKLSAAEEQQLRQQRREESIQAAHWLGYATPCFWDLGDGQLPQQTQALYECIQHHHTAGCIWAAVWPGDGHPDHEAVGLAMQRSPYAALYYPVWALAAQTRLEQFLAMPQILELSLPPEQQQRKLQAAQLFTSQMQTHATSQACIISDEHLQMLSTATERFCYAD